MEEKRNAGNTAVENTGSNTSVTKKTAKAKATKPERTKSSHPPTSEMVPAAIRELKDRKGSSLQAIKKYMATTYKVDTEKMAPFIRKYLKAAIISGAVVQTKGKGASGSFKLSVPAKGSEAKIAKVQKTVKAAEPKKARKSVEKKTTPPTRKPTAAKKPAAVKKAEVAKKPAASKKPAAKTAEKPEKEKGKEKEKAKPAVESKAMSKSKKTAKAPAAKTRTPKPKKVAATKTAKATAKK